MVSSGPLVIKIGGSILRDRADYQKVAQLLAGLVERKDVWAVVSAANGATDALVDLSRSPNRNATRALLRRYVELSGGVRAPHLEVELKNAVRESKLGNPSRLLAWGEMASVCALRAQLLQCGFDLPWVELPRGGRLPSWSSALVPGFYTRDHGGGVQCLTRGGGDISAVWLARRLGRSVVRFWKNGGGVRTGRNEILPVVEAEELLLQLKGTTRPLHPEAVRFAIRHRLELILEDPYGGSASSIVRPPLRHRRGESVRPRPSFPLGRSLGPRLGSISVPPFVGGGVR